MRNLWKSVFGLWVIGMGLGVSAPAQATSAAGPYYATPSWDQKLDCTTAANCPRFIVLTNWNSDAVLDRETGLVWEKSPDTTHQTWENAQIHCNQLSLGGRNGWRLPTLQELASLIDPTVAPPGPTLPPGHPFTVQSSVYWSATTYASGTSSAWGVRFNDGSVFALAMSYAPFVWCVRGGQGTDTQ